jgi:hypothetical protein
VLLVLALGGAQDDDGVFADIEIAVETALAGDAEEGDGGGLDSGEGIETGLEGDAVSHGTRVSG